MASTSTVAMAVALGSLVVVGLGACGSSSNNSTTDSGTTPTDAATHETAPALPTNSITILDKSGADVPADLSCVGMSPDAGAEPASEAGTSDAAADAGDDAGLDAGADAGGTETGGDAGPAAPGTPIGINFKLTQFGGSSSDIVVGAKVDFFFKSSLIGATPDFSGTTDSSGQIALTMPAGNPFIFRVASNSLLKTFVQFDEVAPLTPGTTFAGDAITVAKYNQFALAITGKLGFLTAPGTGIVAGRVRDCQKQDVRNAVLQIIDMDTGAPIPTGPGDTDTKPVAYLSDAETPDLRLTYSSRSGLFAVINTPQTTDGKRHLRMVAKGLFGGSTTLQQFAYRDLEVTADAVNSQYIDPK